MIMFRILLITLLIFVFTGLQAQHFNPLYNKKPAKNWRDSGYYFVPELLKFMVLEINTNPSGVVDFSIAFISTDQSGLTYTGSAILFYREDDLPAEISIEAGSKGFATILLPQDLLYCPSPEAEQGMGQDDPYFPLSLVGRIEKVDGIVPNEPTMVVVQLNDFTVN